MSHRHVDNISTFECAMIALHTYTRISLRDGRRIRTIALIAKDFDAKSEFYK